MEINNEKIKQFLEVVFNKSYENITPEDLVSLDTFGINSQGIEPVQAEKEFIQVLSSCPNLQSLNLKNTYITEKMLAEINSRPINQLYLEGCAFVNENTIHLPSQLQRLEMRKCFFDQYDTFLTNLPTSLSDLIISYPVDETELSASYLNHLTNLKQLTLEGCIVKFADISLANCESLQILNTDVKSSDLQVISTLPSLKKIYISSKFNVLPEVETLSEKCEIKNDLSEFIFDNEESITPKK